MTARNKRRKTSKRKRSPKKTQDVRLQQRTTSTKEKGASADSTALNTTTMSEEMIDETIAESFPASDPPSWTLGREKNVRPIETKKDELTRLPRKALSKKAR